MIAGKLLEAFTDWTANGASLVLASVYDTAGSTYSKPGAQMIIREDGQFQGMLSGGCLEGDLAARAAEVIASGTSRTVTYDLGPNEDELWGLGVGCDGLMRIFLQPLSAGTDYEPLQSIAFALAGDQVEAAATVVASDIEMLPPGASYVTRDGEPAFCNMPDEHVSAIAGLIVRALKTGESASFDINAGGGEATVLVTVLRPPPEILVLGSGLDAEPVVRFANELGWRVSVVDHRPAYLEAGCFAGARAALCIPVPELSQTLDLDRFAAAIVMSHHLESDRRYLAQLAKSRIGYIGLLGPVNRRVRLLQELGDAATALGGRLFSPAGMDIGGHGPAAIALSIIAEMHRALYRPGAA